MSMSFFRKLLIIVLVLIIIKVGGGQVPDRYDTLYTRSEKIILIPVYDTVKQLESANQKADTILLKLALIKEKLKIKDSIK